MLAKTEYSSQKDRKKKQNISKSKSKLSAQEAESWMKEAI